MRAVARPIEHSASFPVSADDLYRTLVDDDYLAARLKELGGKDAAVVSREVDGGSATIVLRQGVAAEFLPSVVRRFTGDDLVLDRTERWRSGSGADVEVAVRGLPGRITGSQEITGDGDAASTLALRGSVKVDVPMVSGKIEGIVAEQVGELLRWEADFTRRYLGG